MVALIIDDLPDLRELVQINLEQDFPHVSFLHAANGVEANHYLEQLGSRVSFIICDYNMPGGNGDLVFKKWQETHFHVPFVMLTSEIARARNSILQGQKNGWERVAFIEKDGDFSQLGTITKELLKVSYLKVPLSWIKGDLTLNYSLSMALNDKKVVQYCHAGDTLSNAKLEELKARGVHDFLIPSIPVLEKKLVWPHLAIQTKSSSKVPGLLESFEDFQNLHRELLVGNFFNEDQFNRACRFIETDVERLMKSELLEFFTEKELTVKNYIINHSFLTGLIGVLFLKELDLDTMTNRRYILESSLFHDIFKSDEEAFEEDLLIDTFDIAAEKKKLGPVLKQAKEFGMTSDHEKIIEALYLNRASREHSNGTHKLARIGRLSHRITSEMYQSSFSSHLSENSLKKHEEDKNLVKALEQIFL